MLLCHEKHAELRRKHEDKEWKAILVFRGDIVKDEEGYLAVFSEQGTSASRLEAAKFMDSLARFRLDDHLECDGEELTQPARTRKQS